MIRQINTKATQALIVATLLVVFLYAIWTTLGPPTIPIVIPTIVSFFAWLATTYKRPVEPGKVQTIYLVAVVVQFAHLTEEYLTGFYKEFPPLFGTQPWSERGFVTIFILGFGILYLSAAIGLQYKNPFANYFLWFVALGPMLVNSIAHPLVSLITRGYFPGLLTAPIQLIVSIVFIRRLISSRIDQESLPVQLQA